MQAKTDRFDVGFLAGPAVEKHLTQLVITRVADVEKLFFGKCVLRESQVVHWAIQCLDIHTEWRVAGYDHADVVSVARVELDVCVNQARLASIRLGELEICGSWCW